MAKFSDAKSLAVHLKGGTQDGFLTTAEDVYDTSGNRSIQAAIDSITTTFEKESFMNTLNTKLQSITTQGGN